jgi:hypothetical protein
MKLQMRVFTVLRGFCFHQTNWLAFSSSCIPRKGNTVLPTGPCFYFSDRLNQALPGLSLWGCFNPAQEKCKMNNFLFLWSLLWKLLYRLQCWEKASFPRWKDLTPLRWFRANGELIFFFWARSQGSIRFTQSISTFAFYSYSLWYILFICLPFDISKYQQLTNREHIGRIASTINISELLIVFYVSYYFTSQTRLWKMK